MSGADAPMDDRRKRVALRRLIDEMLAEIRAAANEENWTADARAQAESDLARIMDQVRHEALHAEPKAKAKAKRAKPH
jgi:ribosome recycling factor